MRSRFGLPENVKNAPSENFEKKKSLTKQSQKVIDSSNRFLDSRFTHSKNYMNIYQQFLIILFMSKTKNVGKVKKMILDPVPDSEPD